MESAIAGHLMHADLRLSNVIAECRASTCRVIMEHPSHLSVTKHQDALDIAQRSLEAFISDHEPAFDPVFMITAYDQETETPHIKAFLRRTGAP